VQGGLMQARFTEFCPRSESRRVDTIAEAQELWRAHGFAGPVPRRFR